jgi:hypothetical protein
MGVEFPSRTEEQRAQVENVINFLRNCPDTTHELIVSPRSLIADLSQFERAKGESQDPTSEMPSNEMEDQLLELLRRGTSLQQEDFLAELRHQRSPQDVASI